MGMCNSKTKISNIQKKELQNYLQEELDKLNNENKVKNNITCEIVSFKHKEDKLSEYGLLIDNYLLNPITNEEKWYDKRTIKYKDKICEFYNIVCLEEKKKSKYLTYENYIKNFFMIEYKKQNKFNS